MAAAPPGAMRPRAISELLDESFRLYRRFFAVLATVAFVVTIPALVLGVGIALATVNLQRFATTIQPGSNTIEFQNFFQEFLASLVPLLAIGGLLILIAAPIIYGATIKAAVDVIAGRGPTVGSVLQGTLRRYFPLLGLIGLGVLFFIGVWAVCVVGIIAAVAANQPLLAFIVILAAIGVAIWLGIRWALVLPVMFAETTGPVRGLARSFQLVRGEWWRTLGILFLLQILIGILQFALGGVFSVVFTIVPGLSLEVRQVLTQIASSLTTAVVSPIPALTIALLYFDLRVRKEGYDLEELARRAAQGPAPA